MKKPFLQFAVNDHLTDLNLRSCHPYACGVWGFMLCIMAQGKPYGHLAIEPSQVPEPNGNGGAGTPPRPPTAPAGMTPPGISDINGDEAYQLPKNGSLESTLHQILGYPRANVEWCITHLEQHGVFSRTHDGIIFSRRMVRDDKKHADKVKRAVLAYRKREESQRRRRQGEHDPAGEPGQEPAAEAAGEPVSRPRSAAPGTPQTGPPPPPPGRPPATAGPRPGPTPSSGPSSAAVGRPGTTPPGSANQNQNQSRKTPSPPTPLPSGKRGTRPPRRDVSSEALSLMQSRKAKEK